MPELVPRVVLDMVARGEARRGWGALALFADVSGFTAMTERLSAYGAEGAELLAEALRVYFDPMLALVQEAGGQVTGFAGDAFTSIFPDDGSAAAAQAAAQAAASMRDVFARQPVRRTRFGDFAFGLKLGLCADRVSCDVATGRKGRSVAYFSGPAVDRSAAAEHLAGRGDVVLAPEVAARVPGWQVAPLDGGWGLLGQPRGEPSWRAFPAPVASAGLRGEALFLPRSALGFPVEGEFRDVTPVFFSFSGVPDMNALARLLVDELDRFGDGALRIDFGDKGGVAWTFFGAPVSFEDQVDRALAFARSVVSKQGGAIKAGVTRGVAYAGFLGGRARAEFTCLGRPVNLAARLMARAPAGEVWCSEAVRERARLHEFWPRGPQALKGFAAPVEALAVAGPARPVARKTAELVAREGELAALEALVEPVFHEKFAGFLYVDGEAGAGKTSLLAALADRLLARGDGAPVVLWGACHALGDELYAPLRSALWGDRDVLGDDPEAELRGALSLLCSWGPVVLFLDDADQIDAGTLRVLRGLAGGEPLALAVVLAARPDDRGNPLRFGLAGAPEHAVELGPFPAEGLKRFMAHGLGAVPADDSVALVMRASGGNPLLASQLIAAIRARSDDPSGPLAPDDVAPLLVARLDRLSVNVRRTVQVASVLGPSLDQRALVELLGSHPRVVDYVRLASKAQIWGRAGDQVTFRSGLLRDAAYQMLPRSRLRRLLRLVVDLHLREGRDADALYGLDQLLGLLPEGPERRQVEQQRAAVAARQAQG